MSSAMASVKTKRLIEVLILVQEGETTTGNAPLSRCVGAQELSQGAEHRDAPMSHTEGRDVGHLRGVGKRVADQSSGHTRPLGLLSGRASTQAEPLRGELILLDLTALVLDHQRGQVPNLAA